MVITNSALATIEDSLGIPRNPSLETIQKFEAVLKQMPGQIEPENHHYFGPGVYLRELVMPAGTLIVGKLHKTSHFLIVTRGLIECKTDNGMEMLKGGDIILTSPGTKRVLLAYEDSAMVTVHVTNKTDLAQIEADVIEPETLAIEGESA